jgi:hypothetical protein
MSLRWQRIWLSYTSEDLFFLGGVLMINLKRLCQFLELLNKAIGLMVTD